MNLKNPTLKSRHAVKSPKIGDVLPIYPLKFTPLFEYRIWGGRNLQNWYPNSLPQGKIGEAWLLSDRDDAQSVVTNGKLKGMSLGEIIKKSPAYILGKFTSHFKRFPLLVKMLDVQSKLSVQVHPSKMNIEFLPANDEGKTEAWIVLEAAVQSKIYAGLNNGIKAQDLRELSLENVDNIIPNFTPKVGQGIMLNAGDVHSMGDNTLIFEIQQNSNVTFRLFDWEHIDQINNLPRPLQIENAIKCVNFNQGAIEPIVPIVESIYPISRERLFDCPFFLLWRIKSKFEFSIGQNEAPTIIFCVNGMGNLIHNGTKYKMVKGDLLLLPATLGVCNFVPTDNVEIIIITIPDKTK